MLTAAVNSGHRLTADLILSDANRITHGNVTLQSANVLVRPTAPGMLVTQ
jgi:hypothetical protein